MSGRLSRKRRAPASPEPGPASLDITDDFSDDTVTFRAPKKSRTVAHDRLSKSNAESLRKSSSRTTASKSSFAPKGDVTTGKENLSSAEKNSSTKNTGKRKEVLVLTLDDDDESDDTESPFPVPHPPERFQKGLSSRVKPRRGLDDETPARTRGKNSSSESTSAAITSSYFSASVPGPKLNLSTRRPRKLHGCGALVAASTSPGSLCSEAKGQLEQSCESDNTQFANEPTAREILPVPAAATECLLSSTGTNEERGGKSTTDESLTAAATTTTDNITADCGNLKGNVCAADGGEEQVRALDNHPSVAPNVRQSCQEGDVSDDEEEHNLDTLLVDPFLAELEKSVCSEHERLCPSCKHIVPADRYGPHLRLCFGKYQYCSREQPGAGEEDAMGGRRRGRSAAVNQTEKSTVKRPSLRTNDGVERRGSPTSTADDLDIFKEQRNTKVVSLSRDQTKLKSRASRAKSKHGPNCQQEQQQEPKEEEQPSKDDCVLDGEGMELLRKDNILKQLCEKTRQRQEGLGGERLPSSGVGGVTRSRQPLLSIAAGVLQVVQREDVPAIVPDPAAALTTDVSCMVRIKRGRGQASSASGGSSSSLGSSKGPSRGRRGRGKKALLATALATVSAEQRSVAIAERVAMVLLSGKPDEGEPWESVTRGRRTAVGTRLSGGVTRVINAEQPLWQLCKSDGGDINEYYVPELAPHVVPPTGGDSLNITMHRHLSQIPGRLNITQSLGLPASAFSDDEEEPYGLDDRDTSALYGPLSTTQLALVRLLGSQADELLNWSIRSTPNTGGENQRQETRALEERQDIRKRTEDGGDRTSVCNDRNGKDGVSCDTVEERSTCNRSDDVRETLDRRRDSETNQCDDISGLSDGAPESVCDTNVNVNEIERPVADNRSISCNETTSSAAKNSSLKCVITKKEELTPAAPDKREITENIDADKSPGETVSLPVTVANHEVSSKDNMPRMNVKGDGKAYKTKGMSVLANAFGDQNLVTTATREVSSSRRGTCSRNNSSCSLKHLEDDRAETILPVDATTIINEAVLRIAHASGSVECIQTTPVNIPAVNAVSSQQLPSKLREVAKEKSIPRIPTVLGPVNSSSTNNEEHRSATLETGAVSIDADYTKACSTKTHGPIVEGVGAEQEASVKSSRSRDNASDVTIVFDASSDTDVFNREETLHGSSSVDLRKKSELNSSKGNDKLEIPGRTEARVCVAKGGSNAKTIIFDMNSSDDNRLPSIHPHSPIQHSSPKRDSPDVILLDDGSSRKSSSKKSNSTNREKVNHRQKPTDVMLTGKDMLSFNKANGEFACSDDMSAHEADNRLKGRPSDVAEESLVPRNCTTIPASDSNASDDATDKMFSKTRSTDIIKQKALSKRTLSNLSVRNLSRFNSLQAVGSGNHNPMSQSSDYMVERYLNTLVRDPTTPSTFSSPSGAKWETSRLSGADAAAERLTNIQTTMLTNMASAWQQLLESGDGGDVKVYTRGGSLAVHSFVLKVRCLPLLREAQDAVQCLNAKAKEYCNVTERQTCKGAASSKSPFLLWTSVSYEASRYFFSYIYGGGCDWKSIEPAVVREVLSLALKYQREDLVIYCQAAATLNQPRQLPENVTNDVADSEENVSQVIESCDEIGTISGFAHRTAPINITPVLDDKSTDRPEQIINPRKSMTFSPSSPVDHDISLPSISGCEKNHLDPAENSQIKPGLPAEKAPSTMPTSNVSLQNAVRGTITADKFSGTLAPTPVGISRLLEGKLCVTGASISQTACTNRSLDKQSKHYKSSATVRSVSPDLFSDGDEDTLDQSVHSREENQDHVKQQLISEGNNVNQFDHSAQSKTPLNHSLRSKETLVDNDVRLRLSSVDQSNSTVNVDNKHNKSTKDPVEFNEISNPYQIGLDNNSKTPLKTVDNISDGEKIPLHNISMSVVHGEDNVIDISQSDSGTSRQSSTPTLTSVHRDSNVPSPHSPAKVGVNPSCTESIANAAATAELYNKTTDAESEAAQTSDAYVSNVWDDFEDMGYCHDEGPLLPEPMTEKSVCDNVNELHEESCEGSQHMRPPIKITDDRPKAIIRGLNSTVIEAAKGKILNLSSDCPNISRISVWEAPLQRRSHFSRDDLTTRHQTRESYSSPIISHASINSHAENDGLHSNSLVRKMFSNDTLLQLQDELQKEWDAEELELSTGINDTSLRSRLNNKRKREDELSAQESPKRKRKSLNPSKRKAGDTGHPLTSAIHFKTNADACQNAPKRQHSVPAHETPSVDVELPDVEGGVEALPHRVQQLQGHRVSARSPSTSCHPPNCSAAADSSLAITPRPDYSTMPTPDLKRRLQQFGIRPLSRNKARALLQHIYEQTHPVVSTSMAPGAGDSEGRDNLSVQSTAAGTGSLGSGPTGAALRTSTPVGRSRAGTVRRAAGKRPAKGAQVGAARRTTSTRESAQTVTPCKESDNQIFTAADGREQLRALEPHHDDDSSTNIAELVDLSQSDGEEDSAPGCAEESLIDLADEGPATAVSDIESVHEQLRCLIVSDPTLHRAVLLYQPLWLHHFKDAAANAGIRCTAAAMVDFLDQQCITFRMGSSTGTTRARTRQKKARKKRGGVA